MCKPRPRIFSIIFVLAAVIQQDAGGSAITNMLAKAQASVQAISEQQNSSPSPTTILKSVNSSGHYMCSQRSNNIEMPSPTVIYHDPSPANTATMRQQNMMQHRNNINNLCHQQDNSNQFEYDENDENSSQTQQFPQYHNNNYNYSHNNHSTLNETQQQADQHTIELRMNNLGNEGTG